MGKRTHAVAGLAVHLEKGEDVDGYAVGRHAQVLLLAPPLLLLPLLNGCGRERR
jgi:hypothetical protein